jgi:predicted nucleotidyltransferase
MQPGHWRHWHVGTGGKPSSTNRKEQLRERNNILDEQELHQPLHHQIITNRFIAACQADERVVAAFIGGSYARGATDIYSDLDFYLVTTDEAYDDFLAGSKAFVRLLGESIFLESYNGNWGDFVFFIFADGTEGELGLGCESRFHHIHGGPYKVLLDKKRILEGVVFPSYEPALAEQIETLQGMINWFWHNLSHHFITPITYSTRTILVCVRGFRGYASHLCEPGPPATQFLSEG